MKSIKQCIAALLEQRNHDNDQVILDIGCGPSKLDSSIGIDLLPYNDVDLVGDALEILREFPDNCVDYLHTKHFLEHINDLDSFVFEFCRVLKNGCHALIIVPHFSNPYFYSDPTHTRPFGLYTFCYYSFSVNLFKRRVPTYMRNISFQLTDVKLHFQTAKGNLIRSALKKSVEILVNSSGSVQEIYEELFCFMFPCYEVRYNLLKQVNKGCGDSAE
jgi:hypothetical protein